MSTSHFRDMEGQTKSLVVAGGSEFCPDTPLHSPSYGCQPSLLYNQHFGLPPLLDFRDFSWMESIYQKLRTSCWSGYLHSPIFTPQRGLHRELAGGVSEVFTQQGRWSVSLDVNHFAPTEITVRTQDGFLEIRGNHNERQDKHGYVSRSFLRKYKLPVGVAADRINSRITVDGVLTVSVPLPDLAPPADLTVSVQVEIQPLKLEDQKTDIQEQPEKSELEGSAIPSSLEELNGKPAAADVAAAADDDEGIRHGDERNLPQGVEVISTQQDKEEEERPEGGIDLVGAADEVQESDVPPSEAADLLGPKSADVIQEAEALRPNVEEEPRCDVSEGKEDVTVQTAVEQVLNIK